MTRAFRPLIASVAGAALLSATMSAPIAAQTVAGAEGSQLDIPSNVQLLGNTAPNVYRPSATVNGEIITATDVEQRLALVRMANNGQLPEAEMPRLRVQIFTTIIDEVLKIQEAKSLRIEVTEAEVSEQYERIAASFRMTPAQFTQHLANNGASERAMRFQIRSEIAWQNLLARNIEPFTAVSEEEVRSIAERLQGMRGTDEVRVGEIYMRADASNIAAVGENMRRMMEQLGQGASFPAYARQFSEATTSATGGDLGWVRPAQLPPTLAAATARMQPGQLAGPIEVPGGLSIIYLIDKRQVLTADPRDTTLTMKQLTLAFPTGTTEAQATALASRFASETQRIAGCGQADAAATTLGATVTNHDQLPMRDLPPQLQQSLGQLQIGQVTPLFGSPTEGVSVLVLCGRDAPDAVSVPSTDAIAASIREDRVNRRAARYLRDLRRDAVIEYS